jgi:hypothetical protein
MLHPPTLQEEGGQKSSGREAIGKRLSGQLKRLAFLPRFSDQTIMYDRRAQKREGFAMGKTTMAPTANVTPLII